MNPSRPIEQFAVPAGWGPAYEKLARGVRTAPTFGTSPLPVFSPSALVNPALDGTATGLIWRATTRRWVSL